MAIKARRPMAKKQDEVQKNGLFTGTAQAGPARPKRAHALAEELLARGCVYIQKQVWDEAAREFRKAIKMEPDYAEAFNNLGLCLLYANKPQEAIDALDQALEYFPGWYIAEANLGLAFQRMGQNEDAAGCYEKAVLKNKKQPAVWLALGDALAALGRIDKALDAYHTAVDLSPQYDMAYYRIGMLQARRNKIDEAEEALLKAVEIEPDNAEATAVLGAIAARKGNLNAARDYFTQVHELEKVPAPAQRGMNRLHVFRKGLRKAFDEWKAEMPETQPLAVCFYNLGLAHMASDNLPEAKEAFHRAADADPRWTLPVIWFGFFAALDGDAVTARKYWDQAVKLEPDNGMVREQLGYLAIAMGLQKEAEAHFKEALRLGRDIPQEDMQPDAGSRLQKAVN